MQRRRTRAGAQAEVLPDRQQDALRFASDFAVPFTDHQAEQDIRMMKVKISREFRTWVGAETLDTLRSVPSTAHKQGIDMLQAFTLQPAVLIHHLSG